MIDISKPTFCLKLNACINSSTLTVLTSVSSESTSRLPMATGMPRPPGTAGHTAWVILCHNIYEAQHSAKIKAPYAGLSAEARALLQGVEHQQLSRPSAEYALLAHL